MKKNLILFYDAIYYFPSLSYASMDPLDNWRWRRPLPQGNGSVRLCILGVPSEGYCFLTGESPVMVEAGGHVAWMAGGGGNAII